MKEKALAPETGVSSGVLMCYFRFNDIFFFFVLDLIPPLLRFRLLLFSVALVHSSFDQNHSHKSQNTVPE